MPIRFTPSFLHLRCPALVAWLLAGLSLAACDDGEKRHNHEHDAGVDAEDGNDAGGDAQDGDGMQEVAIAFAAAVGDETFDCESEYTGLGTSDSDVTFLDFRFYVHDVELVNADGDGVPVTLTQDGVWQYQNLALLDFENDMGTCANGTSETNATVRGTVPEGEYTGVRFKLGVPFDLNHEDASLAPSPLNLTTLFWSWNGGYKFARIDTLADTGDGVNVVNFHLGSTGCNGSGPTDMPTECTNLNVAAVEFEEFDASADTIVFDYAALVAGSDLETDGGGAPGCMSGTSDPECAPMFERLGISLASGEPADGQTAFSVE